METNSIPVYISAFVLASYGTLVAILAIFFLRKEVSKPYNGPAYGFLVVLAFLIGQWFLGFRDFFFRFDLPPRLLIGVLSTLILFVGFGFTDRAHRKLTRLGSVDLCLFQIWRFLPEILIVLLVREGLISDIMTIKGRNFDLWVPVTAPILYFLVSRGILSKKWILAWNGMAVLVLGLTVFTGITSAPFPFRILFTNPPNIVVTLFPVCFLPLFMVPLAFTGHILGISIGWREWKNEEKAESSNLKHSKSI
ncbi:hypothetical protein EHQ12_12500 [Leptospira gomenensis]|uniref:Uncharacterized protein n=1 Tax=Leptospira gomenensis TaxID=2484974 RepID=A0A5F1YNH4_9LEPT|nr:hypothetical protein [Leptospira gomenensis]TGK32752.1 hypothetical protein EHQ17_12345 [Leptospira gomenensis]TGK36900.1 hypothetical protein EHQ12_12500 [Leptospira gomenensis]TGK44371.1 hypothetical protein EHQ07_11815 [Leptospira gomenensis]TGK58864.1 hypothetical protein EHQ13_13635 [Leptospira gomenensis]